MQRPSRKPDVAAQLLSDPEPLDAEEQKAVIAALEEQLLQQNRAFKLGFGGIALVVGLFFVYAALQQHLHPWEARYTGELRPVIAQQTSAAVLFCQGVGLLAAHLAMLTELPKRGERERACLPAGMRVQLLVLAAAVLTVIGFVYWLTALWAMLQKYGYAEGSKWELVWLPALPFGLCLLCGYILHSLQATGQDMQKLKRLQYEYKKV